MAILREGSTGAAVKRLQRKLKKLGFNPGAIDGQFGLATEAALINFQRSEGLLADGIFGPKTATALKLKLETPEPSAATVEVQTVAKMFPQTPFNNIKKHLPDVIAGLVGLELRDKPMALMALATIRAETASFRPISEFQSRFNTSPGGHPFDLYDNRADLGNRGKPDGERFKGRGYIQLTGRHNYTTYGPKVGLGDDLVENPDLANDSKIAGRLLAAFLADKQLPIKRALLEGDLRGARRLVNGGSHGLSAFRQAFRTGDRLIPNDLRLEV